jgi:predicted transposase YbfD/YdcC
MLCTLKKTLNKILKKQHNFLAQVKDNQKELRTWVEFNTSIKEAKPLTSHTTFDTNNHGRYETRICEVYDDLYGINRDWKTKRIIKIISETIDSATGKLSNETRFYISNLEKDAKTFQHIIREHWKIENSLHYVKDVSFGEDLDRKRTDQIPRVATLLKSMAINLLNINNFPNKALARKIFAWNSSMIFDLKGC